jgi:hypothetical protein
MKISTECKKNNISFGSYCEHCGESLEPNTAIWCDGGTWYCLLCAQTMKGFKLTLNEIKDVIKIEKEKQIEYYKKQINRLENDDIDEYVNKFFG